MNSSGIHIKPSHRGLLHRKLGVAQGKRIPGAAFLVLLSLFFAVLSIPWGQYHLLPVAVILLSVALMISK